MIQVIRQYDVTEGLTQTSAPAIEPVLPYEVKDQEFITHAKDDAYIQRLIRRATGFVESRTRRALITQTWRLSMRLFPDKIFVPRPPLQSVSSLSYTDTDGNNQTLVEDTDYVVNTDHDPGIVEPDYNQTWPDTRDVSRAVQLTFVAGYGDDPSDIPEDLRHAIVMVASHWYATREPILSTGAVSQEIAFTVTALLEPYLVMEYG